MPAQTHIPLASLKRLWVLTRPCSLALSISPPFPPFPVRRPALPSAPESAHVARSLAPPTRPGPRPAAEGRGGPGGAALESGRGIRRGVTGKLFRVPGVSLCGSWAPLASAPASFLPPAFAAHQVPSVPGRHGAAAGAQEVTNAGSGQREGGGGRRAGAARPGRTVTTSRVAGPGAGPAGGREAGPSARPRLCTGRGGETGDGPSPAPRPAWRAWKVGQYRAPRGQTPGTGRVFPRGKFTKPRRRKTRKLMGFLKPCRLSCQI